ncbi:MAG TPA: VOC family protein [Bryobacteraceae bacterium]|jgi:catechol 2,3-dioxygenase-like lactoylglutathione lyase family enzyme|nr:VOC family protein [Bryobacteraceae bacterium]
MKSILLGLGLAAAVAAQGPQAAPAGDVVGVGNFSHVVTNLEKSVAFYHDVLGLDVATPPQTFSANPAIMKMTNAIGGQSRIAALKIPGATLGLELIEYKDVDRKPANARFQDPGMGNLALRVRDIDSVVARLKTAGAHVLTMAGKAVEVQGIEKGFFVQDPDGFVVELAQPIPLPEKTESTGNLIGASFEVTIADTDQTVKFYRDLLGFQMRVGDSFNGNQLMAETAGVPGAQWRQCSATIPGSTVRMSTIEFRNTDRKPLHSRVPDPGTALIQLRVRDIDALVKKLKAGGATVVAPDGEPVSVGPVKIAVVRDPNNFYLELISAPAGR